MEVLFIVLNHEAHFDQLMDEFEKHNIRGGTILESQGLVSSMAQHHQASQYGYLRMALNQGRPYNKTIFLVLKEDKVQEAKECVHRVAGNLGEENTGIMFSFKLDSFEGLTK